MHFFLRRTRADERNIVIYGCVEEHSFFDVTSDPGFRKYIVIIRTPEYVNLNDSNKSFLITQDKNIGRVEIILFGSPFFLKPESNVPIAHDMRTPVSPLNL